MKQQKEPFRSQRAWEQLLVNLNERLDLEAMCWIYQ
jgi:hypothetical protein